MRDTLFASQPRCRILSATEWTSRVVYDRDPHVVHVVRNFEGRFVPDQAVSTDLFEDSTND
jgi:hypothetical protein